MLLNESQPSYRVPRLRILANGQPLTGAYAAEVIANNYYSADRFSTVIALGPDPWADAPFWSSEVDILIDVQLSLDDRTSFTSLLQGMADTVSIDPVEGVVRLSGRDFTAALIEARTQEAFSNRTSSEIATILAKRHGLVPSVVATTTPVGRFYQSDHESLTLDRFSRATTEWDLLAYLARQESYDAFITGRSLYFQPTIQVSANAQLLRPTDMIQLKLERALTLAHDIQVTVRSWNSLQGTAFTERITSTITDSPNSGMGQPREYVVVRPNLTPDKALTVAQQQLSELSRHERVVEFSMPGELTLTPRSMIQLDGTGTDFDQTYYINSIERTLRPQTGFLQRIRASNGSPRTDQVLEAAS